MGDVKSWAERGLSVDKFIGIRDCERLKSYLINRQREALRTGDAVPIKHWMLIHIALDSGLRVSEICGLKVSDVCIEEEYPHLFVRHQKGGSFGGGKERTRRVAVTPELADHLRDYIAWKATIGEPLHPDSPLLLSPRGGHFTRQWAYLAFKEAVRGSGIPERYHIHSCRHTYACRLYSASGHNLRMVQKQLGHANIRVTSVYADAMLEDTLKAVEALSERGGSANARG